MILTPHVHFLVVISLNVYGGDYRVVAYMAEDRVVG
jgi:hypothetical protein